MKITEILDEWAKGCSCADKGKPWQCGECTEAMVTAARRRAGLLEGALKHIVEWLDDDGTLRPQGRAKIRNIIYRAENH